MLHCALNVINYVNCVTFRTGHAAFGEFSCSLSFTIDVKYTVHKEVRYLDPTSIHIVSLLLVSRGRRAVVAYT